jgi:cytochrome c
MSDLGFNKIAGALLATGLAILLVREGSSMIFEREAPPTKMGYHVDVVEEAGPGGPAAPVVPPDWGTVLPTIDIAAGQAIVQSKCSSCHNFTPAGTNGTGPGLFGVVGRRPGSHPGFAYSAAMGTFSQTNPTWDYDRLFTFIGGPQRDIPGTKMTFVGLRDPQDRVRVIAYLHSLGSTLPIPAPHPVAAAAPGAGAPAAATAGATNAAAPAATNAAPTATNAAAPAATNAAH